MKKGRNARAKSASERIELGRYIVADPKICHGGVTFRGTRIFVADVLADVERGLSWDFIIQRWGGGRLSREAIAEAVHLARRSLLTPDRKLSSHALPARLRHSNFGPRISEFGFPPEAALSPAAVGSERVELARPAEASWRRRKRSTVRRRNLLFRYPSNAERRFIPVQPVTYA